MFDIKNIDLKKEVADLKDLKGHDRGAALKFLVDYINRKYGDNAADQVINELKKFGFQIPDADKLNNMSWIPVNIPPLFTLSAAKLFNWENKDVFELGKNMATLNFATRILVRYFISPEKTLTLAAKNWQKYIDIGQATITSYDKIKKEIIVKLEGYKTHPIICLHFQALFAQVIRTAIGCEKVNFRETKCMFSGDPYHEFVFNW